MGEAARRGSDEDAALFSAAVSGVRPLADRERRAAPGGGGRRLRAEAGDAVAGGAREARAQGSWTIEPDGRGGRAPGVNRRTLNDLAAGRVPTQATLDLHRLTLASARQRLSQFLARGRSSGLRCVLVVTGKAERPARGADRLRDQVPEWLVSVLSPSVLAFATARREHGGAGALYVLLRGRDP